MAKVMLVTGGSRGIGAAVCRQAAQAGYDVAFSYRSRADAADGVAAGVRSAGRKALAVKADVAEAGDVGTLFDRATDELGPVDAFINNAGIINRTSPLADMPLDEIRNVVNVDLTSAIIAAREAVRRMSTRFGGMGGVIVNISSMASKLAGAGGFIPYGAAKGGIDILTEGLGKEVAGEGIRVVGLRPGLIDTDIQVDTGVPDRIKRFGPTVPMGRSGTADEVASCVIWLCSDGASYVTATSFNISGGR